MTQHILPTVTDSLSLSIYLYIYIYIYIYILVAEEKRYTSNIDRFPESMGVSYSVSNTRHTCQDDVTRSTDVTRVTQSKVK